MRIASLSPAATEWICAMEAGDALVGRSHACDAPPEVRDRPVLTRPLVEEGGAAAVDAAVRRLRKAGRGIWDVDLDALEAVTPDLVLVYPSLTGAVGPVEDAMGARRVHTPGFVSMQPSTYKHVLDGALQLARVLDRLHAGMTVVADGEERLRRLQERLSGAPRPTVAVVQWPDPLTVAGTWVPDLVTHAGGEPVMMHAGRPARRLGWAALREADPDVLVLAPSAVGGEAARAGMEALSGREGWADLRAVQAQRVFLFDPRSGFVRPGPRLYDTVEQLARALHPRAFGEEGAGGSWQRMGARAV